MESRLANPDAECPRCGVTTPPTDARLVTCAACGLTFQPHELQRPHRPRPVPDPPGGLTVTRTPDLVIARWPLERGVGIAIAMLALVPLGLAYVTITGFGLTIATGALAVLATCFGYLAAVLLFDRVELVIAHDALVLRFRPLRLFDSVRIPRPGLRAIRQQFEPATRQRPARHVVLVSGDGPWRQILATRRADHARYLAQLIADTCDLSPR